MRDFTMAKYGELCRLLLGAGYTPVTVNRYLTDPPRGRTVVLRHDVDRKPENARTMARLERDLIAQTGRVVWPRGNGKGLTPPSRRPPEFGDALGGGSSNVWTTIWIRRREVENIE